MEIEYESLCLSLISMFSKDLAKIKSQKYKRTEQIKYSTGYITTYDFFYHEK